MIKEYKLSDKNLWHKIFEDFETKGGAYKLICRENNNVKPIGRLLGTDTAGVLYIGKANNYTKRIVGLKKTIDTKYASEPHICGRRYCRNSKIRENFDYPNLYVQLYSHEEPILKEMELLNEYFEQFGEVPPLNANG